MKRHSLPSIREFDSDGFRNSQGNHLLSTLEYLSYMNLLGCLIHTIFQIAEVIQGVKEGVASKDIVHT